MRDYPAHEDLGLIENDNTEDMRKAPVAADALRSDRPASHHNHEGDLQPMMTQTTGCKHCTVPTPAGQDVCTFCASYTLPETPAQRLDAKVVRR